MEADDIRRKSEDVLGEITSAVIADREVLRLVLTAMQARGHVLLEDVPGTGKTLTARSFATVLGLSYSRIQFTPDLLPADVTGTHVFDEETGELEFQPGPVFANVLLADEINRASPKTQAALLEAMEEGQVTVDGETHLLPDPFFVIATQNPIEQEGTFRLPEAQKDRFMIKSQLGFPELDGELELLDRRANREAPTPSVRAICTTRDIEMLQQAPEHIHVEDDVRRYIAELTRATRDDSRVDGGVSPRGTQRLFEAARAWASSHGRTYVTPDDVKRLAGPVLAHRLVLTADARVANVEKHGVIEDLVESVRVPTVDRPGRTTV